MTPTQHFIIELLKEGKGYLKLLLPAFGVGALTGWHWPQPWYMKKE